MTTHVVGHHRGLVLALVLAIAVGTIVENNFVVVKHMVVQVAASTKALVALATLVGVHCASEFECVFATHVHSIGA
jgi:hypothetical protein